MKTSPLDPKIQRMIFVTQLSVNLDRHCRGHLASISIWHKAWRVKPGGWDVPGCRSYITQWNGLAILSKWVEMIIGGMKAVEQKDRWFNSVLLRPPSHLYRLISRVESTTRQNIGPIFGYLRLAPSRSGYLNGTTFCWDVVFYFILAQSGSKQRFIFQSRQEQPPPTAFSVRSTWCSNNLRLKQLSQAICLFSAVINCSRDINSCYWELAVRSYIRHAIRNPPLGGHIFTHSWLTQLAVRWKWRCWPLCIYVLYVEHRWFIHERSTLVSLPKSRTQEALRMLWPDS